MAYSDPTRMPTSCNFAGETKALVTTSDALVPSSVALVTTSKALVYILGPSHNGPWCEMTNLIVISLRKIRSAFSRIEWHNYIGKQFSCVRPCRIDTSTFKSSCPQLFGFASC